MSELSGYKRTKVEILIQVNGEYISVEPDDLRLLDIEEILVRESFERIKQ